MLNADEAELILSSQASIPVNLSVIRAATISGKLSRPLGADDSQSISPSVQVIQFDQTGAPIRTFSAFLNIGPREQSVEYSLEVPPLESGFFRLEYDCFSCPGIVTSGFFNPRGTTLISSEAQLVSFIEISSSLDFRMVPALSVSGELFRPLGVDLSDRITSDVSITQVDEDGNFLAPFSAFVAINAGEQSAQFSVDIPPNASSGSFRLAYSCCLLYTSPSPRDQRGSRMPSSA